MRASPKSLLLASSFAAVVAVPCFVAAPDAHAQAGGAALTNYPACTNKPTPADSDAAHSAYLLGKRFFEESDYGSASHNFTDAFKLDCTKPELLLNIARADELLGNRPEAVHALETYMTRGTTLTADDKAQLQRRIDNLKAAIAAQAPVVAAPIIVPPAPTTAPVSTTAPPPPPVIPPAHVDEQQHTVTPWIVTGVGGASLITGIALYFVGHSELNTANTLCRGDASNCNATSKANSDTAQSKVSSGDTLEIAGSVLLYGGLAIAAGGIIWHFVEPTGPAKPDATKASFTPVVGPGYTGASVVGHF